MLLFVIMFYALQAARSASTFNYTYVYSSVLADDFGLNWTILWRSECVQWDWLHIFCYANGNFFDVSNSNSTTDSFSTTIGPPNSIVIGNLTTPINSQILLLNTNNIVQLHKYNTTSKISLLYNYNLAVDNVLFHSSTNAFGYSITNSRLYKLNTNSNYSSYGTYNFTGETLVDMSVDTYIVVLTRNKSIMSSGNFYVLDSNMAVVKLIRYTNYNYNYNAFISYDCNSNLLLRGKADLL